MPWKERIKSCPFLGPLLVRAKRSCFGGPPGFPGSQKYWDLRYKSGGTSGVGSVGELAEFKAEIINSFVSENRIQTVIEFGCGDGGQLRLARYPSYVGFDVSSQAVSRCRQIFKGDPAKSFEIMGKYAGERAQLTLSLDVIYHLVEDEVFESHMIHLFDAAEAYVIIYSSDTAENPEPQPPHQRHRKFTSWIETNRPEWRLARHTKNRYPYRGEEIPGSLCDFFIYERR
jgi:hypothetical protein